MGKTSTTPGITRITERVRRTIAKYCGERDLGQITDEANLSKDLGLSSIQVVALLQTLEEEFDVDIDGDVERFCEFTVLGIATTVANQVEG